MINNRSQGTAPPQQGRAPEFMPPDKNATPSGYHSDPLDSDEHDLPRIAYGIGAALEAVECSIGFWIDEPNEELREQGAVARPVPPGNGTRSSR